MRGQTDVSLIGPPLVGAPESRSWRRRFGLVVVAVRHARDDARSPAVGLFGATEKWSFEQQTDAGGRLDAWRNQTADDLLLREAWLRLDSQTPFNINALPLSESSTMAGPPGS